MKLFLYDTKHQQVNGNCDLGNLSDLEINLVNKILEFLQDQCITDGQYRNLVLADDIETMCLEDEEVQLVIRNSR